jgi:hypothetical protein
VTQRDLRLMLNLSEQDFLHQGWLRGFLTLSSMDYEGFLFWDECDFGLKLTAFLFVVSGSKMHGNVNLT